MNTILSFMDKLYSDSKTLSMVYVIGAILLFVFVLLLMFSLRKPKDEPKIIDEPKIDEEPKKEENIIESKKEEPIIEEKREEVVNKPKEEIKPIDQSIFEKTTIIPLDEIDSKETIIEKALDNVDNYKTEEVKEEPKVDIENISSEIPNVDEFVDNVVKKTYEKNEQFSSVYVGDNTSTIKLDKVMEDLNVDENVVESIVPEEEKTLPKEEIVEPTLVVERVEEPANEPKEEVVEIPQKIETVKEETTNSLDNLKKALDEKKKEVNEKQDELKAKLEGLKQAKTVSNDTIKAEDLLNKLNNIKEK